MPARRELNMRQLRHLLRLHHDGVSAREIGRRLGVARSTIQDNLKRATAAELTWPLSDDVTDEALERRLFGRAGAPTGQRRRVEPEWAALARELKRPGVTMTILWEEYREVHPESYGYSRFCDLLRGFERRLTPVMRQHHVAGDKAKVEAGVRFAQTYILGRLRRLTFFSLAECNEAIAAVMRRMNERPMRNLGLSRRELFEKIERDVLSPLPAEDWEFAEWRRARVNLDYHIEVHDFLYSVPHALIRAEVEVRVTARTVEIFHRGQRVAAHQRRYMGPRHGTDSEHMPGSHRRYAEWTPERFRRWAGTIGPNTEGLILAVLASRPHPEQGFRTCLGILRSYRGVETARLEAVSARAVETGLKSRNWCRSIWPSRHCRSPAGRGPCGSRPTGSTSTMTGKSKQSMLRSTRPKQRSAFRTTRAR